MTAIAFLVILVVYLAIAAGVTYWLTKFGASTGTKWMIGLSSLFAFLVLAVWDEVWGYVYLRHLCSSEGGIKVYRTVALGPEHWNDDGSPRFSATFKPFLDSQYEMKAAGTTILRWPLMTRNETAIVDRGTGERLVAYVSFATDRGWMLQSPGWQVNRRVCATPKEVDLRMVTAAFRKSPSK